MKYNKLSTFLLSGLLLFGTGCGSNDDEPSFDSDNVAVKGDKLLSHEWYSMDGKSKDYLVSIYYYDDAGRILKVEHPRGQQGETTGEILSYEDYYISPDGRTERILYYTQNLYEGYVNLQTEVFTFSDNGMLMEKTLLYPVIHQTEKTIYSYSNGLLSKESGYDNSGKLINTTEYAYDKGNKLVSEVMRGSDKTINRTHIHTYKDGLLVRTDIYAGEKRGTHLREILYTYDNGNNLIKKVSNEIAAFSSMRGGVTLYEYYD